MTFTFSRKWFLIPGLILFVFGALLYHAISDALVQYPLDTWRMDLDDLVANIGTGLLGIGTILLGVAALRKAGEALNISKRNEHSINGGLAEVADLHVRNKLDDAEIEPGLWKRVDMIEQSNKECLEREARMKELIQDVYCRLDKSELGREDGRD